MSTMLNKEQMQNAVEYQFAQRKHFCMSTAFAQLIRTDSTTGLLSQNPLQ